MLGRLARWLRILGVDAIYLETESDEEILGTLRRGDTLFTRDKALARRAEAKGVVAVRLPETFEEQLLTAARVLGLKLEVDMEKTRCPLCGGRLRRAERAEVHGRVPEAVEKTYEEFYVCERCGHIYWVGTHMREIESTLRRIRGMRHGVQAHPR